MTVEGISMKEKKFTLRISEDLLDSLKTRSEQNRRSINNEILVILERYIATKETNIDNKNQVDAIKPNIQRMCRIIPFPRSVTHGGQVI